MVPRAGAEFYRGLPEALAAGLRARIEAAGFRGQVAARDVEALCAGSGEDPCHAMLLATAVAKAFARVPVSGFRVGAVARGASGAWYLGANLEFTGLSLRTAVHAEQSAVAVAWTHGERAIAGLAVSAAPCGFCRQFLSELADAEQVSIVSAGEDGRAMRSRLGDLLPSAFRSSHLGRRAGLLDPACSAPGLELVRPSADPLVRQALEQARRSYAIHTGANAAVALRTDDGAVVAAPYAENAAFNPSLTPVGAALACLAVTGRRVESVRDAVLVEIEGLACSHHSDTETVLRSLGFDGLRTVSARASGHGSSE